MGLRKGPLLKSLGWWYARPWGGLRGIRQRCGLGWGANSQGPGAAPLGKLRQPGCDFKRLGTSQKCIQCAKGGTALGMSRQLAYPVSPCPHTLADAGIPIYLRPLSPKRGDAQVFLRPRTPLPHPSTRHPKVPPMGKKSRAAMRLSRSPCPLLTTHVHNAHMSSRHPRPCLSAMP